MKRITSSGSVLALAALLTVSLAACQAGSGASTSQAYDPVDGRNVNVPADATGTDPYLAVRGAQVVDLGDAHSLVVTLVNHTDADDALTGVSIAGQPVDLSTGTVDLPVGEAVAVGPGGAATAIATGIDVDPGDWVDVQLRFGSSGVAELSVLAVPLR